MLSSLFLLTVSALASSSPDYLSAKKKLDQISEDDARRGSTINLSLREVNAFAVGEAAEQAPGAFRNLKIGLGNGSVHWYATVNFAKLAESEHTSMTAALMLRMLEGEKPLDIKARVRSSGGKATVLVDSVTIDGTPMEGAMLNFMVAQLLTANIEGATVGEPFDLEHNVEQILITPTGVDLKIRP